MCLFFFFPSLTGGWKALQLYLLISTQLDQSSWDNQHLHRTVQGQNVDVQRISICRWVRLSEVDLLQFNVSAKNEKKTKNLQIKCVTVHWLFSWLLTWFVSTLRLRSISSWAVQILHFNDAIHKAVDWILVAKDRNACLKRWPKTTKPAWFVLQHICP